MLKSIRIENPVSDCRFTTKNRAKRFVTQGRAVWVEPGVSIRFIAADHRHRAAQASVDTSAEASSKPWLILLPSNRDHLERPRSPHQEHPSG